MRLRSALFIGLGALLLGAGCTWLVAADRQIGGRVTDWRGRPLADVVVRGAGLGAAAVTGTNGEFSLLVPEGAAPLRLVFALDGYREQVRVLARPDAATRLTVRLMPQPLLREEVTVTALNEPEKAASVPFAQSVVPALRVREKQPETVVEAALGGPGLQVIGKGGVAITPSIRGLARRRVLVLLNGARLISDRSAGTSAAFVPAELIERLEVVRSAAAVLYGSDAIGGVLQVFTLGRREGGGRLGDFQLSGNTASDRLSGALTVGGRAGNLQGLLFVQHARAGDYRAPGLTILRSGYEYTSSGLALAWSRGRSDVSLHLLASWGRNIGKPERANDPGVYSLYPHERNLVLDFSWRQRDLRPGLDLHLNAFIAPSRSQLQKIKRSTGQVEESNNSSFDFGWRGFLRRVFSPALSGQLGVDYFGRLDVDMENVTRRGGTTIAASTPLADGRRGDIGLYATFDYSGLKLFDLVGGARYSLFRRTAVSDGRYSRKSGSAPAFFVGLTRHVGPHLSAFVNAGSAYRLPSLSEAFYTGISGRTSIRGNPALQPEKSLNLDAGLKWSQRRLFAGLYLFRYQVRGWIEKFQLPDGVYTYGNLNRGVVRGAEIEFQWLATRGAELFGNAVLYRGRDAGSGAALNDVPAARALLGVRVWKGRCWGELNWTVAKAKTDPGPAEVAVAASQVTDLKAGCYLSSRLSLFVKAGNLFNRFYYANADPDIPPARGFELAVGVSGSF